MSVYVLLAQNRMIHTHVLSRLSLIHGVAEAAKTEFQT
jgi:hypothetical protein